MTEPNVCVYRLPDGTVCGHEEDRHEQDEDGVYCDPCLATASGPDWREVSYHPYTPGRIIDCGECVGRGYVMKAGGHTSWPCACHGTGKRVERRCETCKGEGYDMVMEDQRMRSGCDGGWVLA